MLKNILVIDNDAEMPDLLDEIFCETEYQAFVYEDADNIFNLISHHKPKLILLDFNLNGMNGGELCTLIKKNSETKSLPVVLFSAYPRIIYDLPEYGSDGFLEKPFDIDEFMQLLNDFCA